jgi:hypothetical protein
MLTVAFTDALLLAELTLIKNKNKAGSKATPVRFSFFIFIFSHVWDVAKKSKCYLKVCHF